MSRIEGNITHQSRNPHLILNLGRKSAIKLVSKEKQKITHTVFVVVQSLIRTENLERYLKTCRTRGLRSCDFGVKGNP